MKKVIDNKEVDIFELKAKKDRLYDILDMFEDFKLEKE